MSSQRLTLNMPLNRVEGDLEVEATIEKGVVTKALSKGTTFRGFESILEGRSPMDALVITPRICGICSIAHLTATVRALESIDSLTPPDQAIRLRNLALMLETIQSDLRHGFLFFATDLANPRNRDLPFYEEVKRRHEPFRGSTWLQTLDETKRATEALGLLAGQWPHGDFMVPGGVAGKPTHPDLLRCGAILARYRRWYEERVLGCTIEQFDLLNSAEELAGALDKQSELTLFLRFSKAAGLDRMGRGCGSFLSFGNYPLPTDTRVGDGGSGCLVPAGFLNEGRLAPFDPCLVREDISHSWLTGYEGERHPSEGTTDPYVSGNERGEYSFAKAPRYDGRPAETGPLAEALIAQTPLFRSLVDNSGPNAMLRQLARLTRPARLLPAMEAWLQELIERDGSFYQPHDRLGNGEGSGLIEAARGALGHWVAVEKGKIHRYQIITPTTWNASPRDAAEQPGPWETALQGTPVKDVDNPVELGYIVRSFDACMVCSVHTFHQGRRSRLKV